MLAWDSCILPGLFLQVIFPVRSFAWESAACLSSKKQEQQQTRFSDSWGIGNPQTWRRITSPEQTDSPPTVQPLPCTGLEAAGTNCSVSTLRCNKPKYAPFSTSVTWGWIAALKERLDTPPARFRLPKDNKAGFKITTLSQTLWGNSKANLFHLSWTHTEFRNSQVQ